MLYVTTRNNRDAYTAHHALKDNRGPDGGLYVPFREPSFSPGEIASLREKSFNKCVSEVLNVLFNTHLSGYDIDFAIGRYSVRLEMLGKRIILGECWHNLESDFDRMVKNLTKLLLNEADKEPLPGDWAGIGIRIAVLFGIFGELMRQGILNAEGTVDISVVSGDFSAPISAWYARRWGLPIGNILCCCNENGNLWDFICHGQLKTGDTAVPTVTPKADVVVPAGLERLIYSCAGTEEVENYLKVLRSGGNYYLDDVLLHRLRQGLYVTVTSEHRVLSTIPSVFSTHARILSPYSALAFAGLQDYRARTGENRIALILEDRSPALDMETVSRAMGISADMLKQHLN